MEVDTKKNIDPKKRWKVSWVGYIRAIISTIIRTAIYLLALLIVSNILSAIFSFDLKPYKQERQVLAIIFVAVLLLIKILYTRSISLYYDDIGVWNFSGIFPWSKGITGVKWENIDEATYKTGFLNWAFKSYEVTIKHKYTKANEIILPNILKGDNAVMHINNFLETKGYANTSNSIIK